MQSNITEEITVFGDDVDLTILPEFRTLYRYWSQVRGKRWAPPWEEFRLDQIPFDMLPWCVVVDVRIQPLDFIYRFWGTQVRKLTHVELTGKSVDTIPNQSYAKRAREEYSEVFERRVAMFSNQAHTDTNGLKSRYQALRVPFSSGDKVENILSVGGHSLLPYTDINYFKSSINRLVNP